MGMFCGCLAEFGCLHCTANKALIKYTKRLQSKQQQLKSWQFEHPEDRDTVIQHVPTQNVKKKLESYLSAVEQKDSSSIEHVESTTAFLTELEIFKDSMPRMITDVKTISKNRLSAFREYLLHFVTSKFVLSLPLSLHLSSL